MNTPSAAIASFTINEGPVFIDAVSTAVQINKSNENSGSFALICAVTSKGHLFIYSSQLDTNHTGKVKKPVKPIHQVQIETHEGQPLNIFGAFVTNESNERLECFDESQTNQLILCLIYGTLVNPVVEKVEFSSLTEPKTVFRRTDPSKIDVTIQIQSTKVTFISNSFFSSSCYS